MLNLADSVRLGKRLSFLPGIGKLVYLLNFLLFNSSVPLTVKIGERTRFAYGGIGCVIHADSIIGSDVIIGQGITIGGDGNRKGVPVIGDKVYLGAGCRVLGPIEIGEGARVGANAVVLQSIPPYCTAVGAPARIIKGNLQDPASEDN